MTTVYISRNFQWLHTWVVKKLPDESISSLALVVTSGEDSIAMQPAEMKVTMLEQILKVFQKVPRFLKIF